MIRRGVEWLDAREPMSGTERIALWLEARGAMSEFAVVIRDLETDATDAAIELTRERGVDELETPLGVVHVGWTAPVDHWRGYELIGKLAQTVVEVDAATGELATQAIRAVPIDVLRAVVAGCDTEKRTSSAWRKTGLEAVGIDPRDWYVRVKDPRPVIRSGPKR